MNCRSYGKRPYLAVAVHGGPGAPGSASSLARMLSSIVGTLEPFQTASSVKSQVDELAAQIREYTQEPVILFGHSWGAWLSFLLAYSQPEMVRKVFLIGSGAFDASYVNEMESRRLSHMTAVEANEYNDITKLLSNVTDSGKDALLVRLGYLAGRADNFCVDDTTENNDDIVRVDGNQYDKVWPEGAELRKTGYFMRIASEIKAPIRIIHGADDPTPIEGVVKPLEGRVQDLKWYRLERCGHSPWKERYAKDEFWRIVKIDLAD